MKIEKTDISGCYFITNDAYHDNRGYFSVPFNRDILNQKLGYDVNFIQDNKSYSHKNVIRGLHFQNGDHAQAKLVSCHWGRVLDVVVDIRKDSLSFGKVVKIELAGDKQLFVPRGCAHGFSVLSDFAIFYYKVDNEYNKESEDGILYNDHILNINWYVEPGKEIVSEKDKQLRKFLSL